MENIKIRFAAADDLKISIDSFIRSIKFTVTLGLIFSKQEPRNIPMKRFSAFSKILYTKYS